MRWMFRGANWSELLLNFPNISMSTAMAYLARTKMVGSG
jgi:hypothetical protein